MKRSLQEPREETWQVGLVFLAAMLPLLGLNAWLSILIVSKWKSVPTSLLLLLFCTAVLASVAAFVMQALLRLPLLRCLKECFSGAWAFFLPCLYVYFWDLPRVQVRNQLIIAVFLMLAWFIAFWIVFAANRPNKFK